MTGIFERQRDIRTVEVKIVMMKIDIFPERKSNLVGEEGPDMGKNKRSHRRAVITGCVS